MDPSDVKGTCYFANPIEMSADCNLDLSFDWSIRYSAMSPAKLSLAQSTIRSAGIWAKMHDASYFRMAQDKEELNSKS